jgi:hypothetical protein
MLLIRVSVLLNVFYEGISKLYTEEASETASVHIVTLTNKYIMSHQSKEQACLIIIESFYSVLGTVRVYKCTLYCEKKLLGSLTKTKQIPYIVSDSDLNHTPGDERSYLYYLL